MLIDKGLLRFCAEKTRELAEQYARDCVLSSEDDEFPRSPDDLHTILMGIHGKPILHRQLRISVKSAKYRSFYIPYPDRIEIYYASEMSRRHIRFYKTKELLQSYLIIDASKTQDIVELVKNMILRESSVSTDLDLGHSTTSDTLGEIAAMQFLFPIAHRIECLQNGVVTNKIADLANKYDVPDFVIQRGLNIVPGLGDTFS